jgi:conjugative transfer pilus assembly protein TraH
VGVNQRGLSQDTIDAFRGLVGDIEFVNNKMKIEVRTILPCSGQTATDTNIFLGGTPALRKEFDVNAGGILPCTPMPDTNANLTTYVTKKMQSIADKMASKSAAFTASDQAFLDSNPMGLSMTLRTAIGTSTEVSTIANMSEITAKAYAYYMMSDLYAVGLSTVFALSQAMDNGMVHKEGCDLSTLEPNTKIELASFIKKIDTMKSQSMASYQASINEQQAVQAYLKSVNDMQGQLYDRIAKDFGATVAGRIAKR